MARPQASRRIARERLESRTASRRDGLRRLLTPNGGSRWRRRYLRRPRRFCFWTTIKRIGKSFLKPKISVIVFPVAELSPHRSRGVWRLEMGWRNARESLRLQPATRAEADGNFFI